MRSLFSIKVLQVGLIAGIAGFFGQVYIIVIWCVRVGAVYIRFTVYLANLFAVCNAARIKGAGYTVLFTAVVAFAGKKYKPAQHDYAHNQFFHNNKVLNNSGSCKTITY